MTEEIKQEVRAAVEAAVAVLSTIASFEDGLVDEVTGVILDAIVEQCAAEDAYVLELAKAMAVGAYPEMRWDEWTSGTPESFQEGFIREARAALVKLDADGRLLPVGFRAVGIEPAGPESWAAWQDVPEGVRYRSAAEGPEAPIMGRNLTFMNHADGKRWVHRRDNRHHLSDSNEARMQRLAPFVRAEVQS
jgi:hypothetical protein